MMAFGSHERKTLLYSDLFKSHKNNKVLERDQKKLQGSSNQSSSCDSLSSGFSTPVSSLLGSSESDDGDFMAELTRQMAECMLQEDEEKEDEQAEEAEIHASNPVKNGGGDSGAFNNRKNACFARVDDDGTPPVQVYELKNQPPVSKQGPVCRGRRVKGAAESARHKQKHHKTEQHFVQQQYRGVRGWQSGSGMQAVFLGGSGQKYGSSGTGVFLPRVTNDPVEPKKKSGCSMVLIPTRVLQALELHFSRLQDSTAPPLCAASPNHSCPKVADESIPSSALQEGDSQLENKRRAYHDDETQLPQEWTY